MRRVPLPALLLPPPGPPCTVQPLCDACVPLRMALSVPRGLCGPALANFWEAGPPPNSSPPGVTGQCSPTADSHRFRPNLHLTSSMRVRVSFAAVSSASPPPGT
eukprot:EG_transcript_31197